MGLFALFHIQTPSWSSTYIQGAIFFPVFVSGFIVKDQVSMGVFLYLHLIPFNLIPLINLPGFMPTPCYFISLAL